MGPANEIQIMLVQELLHDIGAKCEGDAAIALAPPRRVLVGIGPQKIAQQAWRRSAPRGKKVGK